MDLLQSIANVLLLLGISSGTAAWLAKKFIEHRLKKDLEQTKAELEDNLEKEKAGWNKDLERLKSDLQANLEKEKAVWEGSIKKEVETALGDRAADREYDLEARKRLYRAIGPLRFQLLLACRDLSGRIISHGLRKAYETDVREYYGQSTLFRILRPLTLAELAERQIAYADFSVDSSAVDLLRFHKGAFAIFSGSSLVQGHSGVNWESQDQHVVFGDLDRAANALIVQDAEHEERCMRFHEMEQFLTKERNNQVFEPFPSILSDFTPKRKPLFWLRLVAYGYLCNEYINTTGKDVGFETRSFPLANLLDVSDDSEIKQNIVEYEERCRAVPKSPL